MVARYPEAEWTGDGTTYGPLPDDGWERKDVRLILHTTETKGMPSYGNGDNAPHFSYHPGDRAWTQHADLDKRVGTDKSYGNPVSIAVEILCYSDQSIAEEVGGTWVGDLSEGALDDLAKFGAWLQEGPWPELKLDQLVYGPAHDFPTFLYGTSASTRMDKSEWSAFGGGLTGHGASPSGTSHWDSGALDLYDLSARIAEELEPEEPNTTLVKMDDEGAWVQFWACTLNYAGAEIEQDHAVYDETMKAAVLFVLPNSSGKKITGRQGAIILHRSI